MDNPYERRCCQEIQQVYARVKEGREENQKMSCITQHPAFSGGCLNVYALEITYLQYRQLYGRMEPLHE
jgi:hypothetical protein